MTKHEFMKMLLTAQQIARESVECALAASRKIDLLTGVFYSDNFEPMTWTFDTKEADNAEDNN